jgi:hypothetical protein
VAIVAPGGSDCSALVDATLSIRIRIRIRIQRSPAALAAHGLSLADIRPAAQ